MYRNISPTALNQLRAIQQEYYTISTKKKKLINHSKQKIIKPQFNKELKNKLIQISKRQRSKSQNYNFIRPNKRIKSQTSTLCQSLFHKKTTLTEQALLQQVIYLRNYLLSLFQNEKIKRYEPNLRQNQSRRL